MQLINQTKSEFKLGKDSEGEEIIFRVGEVKDFDKGLSATLLRYEGINSIDSLKADNEKLFAGAPKPKTELDLLKEEATELGIEYAGNVSKAKLTELVEEAKTAPDA